MHKRVLIISQLPKEAGGSYTSGIARVAENLYQKDFGKGLEIYWYFTNVPQKIAKAKCKYENQYNGYKKMPFRMIGNLTGHPIKTFREWRHYKKVDEVNPLRYEFYKTNFQSVLRKVRPDLIHLHGAGMAPLYYANLKTKKPIIITFHGVMFNEDNKASWHFKPSYIATIQMANFFTVLNKETKRKALLLGMPEEKCTIIPNGVDTSLFYFSKNQREILRNSKGISDSTQIFITVGVVIDRKGQYDFMLFLEKLGIDFQYWIIGKGPDEKRIADYVAEHHLEQRVKLLGYVEGKEMYKYLSAADIYAHVSTTEGQALSEIEAYTTGMRVIVRKDIANTVIGNAEHDHLTYYVWDAEKTSQVNLSNWLKQVIVRRESKVKFDWSEIAHQYGNLYYNLLS